MKKVHPSWSNCEGEQQCRQTLQYFSDDRMQGQETT